MRGISVVVPVGPEQHHRRYLEECLLSVERQSVLPNEILLVDDMAGMADIHSNGFPIRTWRAPWRLGVSAAFNCGVALAEQELVLMLGADDWLEPECVEECLSRYEEIEDPLGYYSLTVKYHAGEGGVIPLEKDLPDGIQTAPCGAAMVTKTLWVHTGGFPYEAATSSDGAFISILMTHPKAGKLIPVQEGIPLYNYRVWEGTDTRAHGRWNVPIMATRNLLAQEWKQPQWGRY